MKLILFVSAFGLVGGLFTFACSLFVLLMQLFNLTLGRLFAFASLALVNLSMGQLS